MNKNQYKGWKVITKNRMSLTQSTNDYALHYPINKEVSPKLKLSKLYFFRYKKNANEFVINREFLRIVPCIATNPKKERYVCFSTSTLEIKQTWNGFPVSTVFAPKGTYVADSIKCLE